MTALVIAGAVYTGMRMAHFAQSQANRGNARLIYEALREFYSQHGRFPELTGPDGQSWRLEIIPFVHVADGWTGEMILSGTRDAGECETGFLAIEISGGPWGKSKWGDWDDFIKDANDMPLFVFADDVKVACGSACNLSLSEFCDDRNPGSGCDMVQVPEDQSILCVRADGSLTYLTLQQLRDEVN